MNDYEAKKQARIDRYRERAAKSRQEWETRHRAADATSSHIPFGQPILVGHHSEKRHRRDLAKIDGHLRKAVEADDKAKHYEAKAAAAESNTAISSDNPDALDLLRERLAELEAEQSRMKAVNAACRKAKGDLHKVNGDLGLTPAELKAIEVNIRFSSGSTTKPYPSYCLSNNNANMARVRERIAQLERRAAAVEANPEPIAIERAGWKVTEDVADNRLCLSSPTKPPESVRTLLKRSGFRWSPSRVAWVRQLNGSARAAADYALGQIEKLQITA